MLSTLFGRSSIVLACSTSANMSYEAHVCRVFTSPHPNADKLQLGHALGYQVIVGLDTQDGELGVLFPEGGQLSHDFVDKNRLYQTHPETGEKQGGYFCKKRRVRAQKFRGENSEGFWVPMRYLRYLGPEAEAELVEGHSFTHLGGVEVCRKYVTPATNQARGAQAKKKRKEPRLVFEKHYDTGHLRENLGTLRDGVCTLWSEKLHGTSARSAYARRKLRWWERAWNKVVPRRLRVATHVHVSGTRNTVLGKSQESKKDFRHVWHDRITPCLKPGEAVYYEIVGYEGPQTPIMSRQSLDGLPKKERKALERKYGDPMVYSYGLEPGENDIYVYRMTREVDGEIQEYPWCDVEQWCRDHGFKTVPVLSEIEPDADIDVLEYADQLAQGESTLGGCIKEGVCVRQEWQDPDTGEYVVTRALKHKSFLFLCLEGHAKIDDDYVDAEEVV